MATTSIATLQTIWGCKWSRPGCRLAGVDERFQPEPVWVCIRDGVRKIIPEEKCEHCERWEADSGREN